VPIKNTAEFPPTQSELETTTSKGRKPKKPKKVILIPAKKGTKQ
jgi:hypothetical protein